MQGIPFWQTSEFWTAVVTIVVIIFSRLVPSWKDTIDQLTPYIVTIIVALVVRTAAVQTVQFAQSRTYDRSSKKWANID
jgi:hypothetical protein